MRHCFYNFSQPSRFANTVALAACCAAGSALRHSHSRSPSILHFLYFCRHSAFNPSPPVPAAPSPCPTLTFTKSDLTNLSHQPGNPTLPQPTVKVVSAFFLTQPSPTVIAQKTLPGMVTGAAMPLDARAAAGAPPEGIGNAAAAVFLPDVRIPATTSMSLA